MSEEKPRARLRFGRWELARELSEEDAATVEDAGTLLGAAAGVIRGWKRKRAELAAESDDER